MFLTKLLLIITDRHVFDIIANLKFDTEYMRVILVDRMRAVFLLLIKLI